MALELSRNAIDIGIVTKDAAASATFWSEVVGLPELGPLRMDGFDLRRFQVGDCILKIVQFDDAPPQDAPTGPLGAATGIRYWTISVTDLAPILAACEKAGRPVVEGPTEMRPGVSIVLIEDPDGNLVEFVSRPAS